MVMKSFGLGAVGLASALALGALVQPVLAKPAAAAPQHAAAPSGSGPQVTDVKEFGDWTVRCYAVSSPAPCEMLEVRVAKKTGQRVMIVLLTYAPQSNQHVMQIGVPLGVALQNGLVVSSDSYTSPVMHFRQCDQQGCYVVARMDNDSINSLAKATKAELQLVLDDGRKLNLPFSLDGFTAAHNAMVDLAKSKATSAPPASTDTPDQSNQGN